MTPRSRIWIFLGLLTALRLVYCSRVELSPDEAYYLQWSEHLAPSYFSKGPGVAATMWLSTRLFGVSEFGVRAFSPLLALGTSLLLAGLARRFYGEKTAIWTVVLINCTPIFNAGALVMTIDPLSIFFWTAALGAFWRALDRSPAFSWWWPLTGALIGAGFLAKYTNAMQILSIVLLLAITPKYRREFRGPGFAALLVVFALCTTPVLSWNAQHDWITLRHLTERGGLSDGPRFRPGEFFVYLGLHFGVYSPFIFGAMLVALFWSWKNARVHFRPRFLLVFTLPLLVLYFTLSLKQTGEPNWTAPAMASLAILTVACWQELAAERKWVRPFAVLALGFGAVLSLVMANTDLLRVAGFPLPFDKDPSARLRGWRDAAEHVEALRRDYEAELGQPVFLIANHYGTASALAFYLTDQRREGPGHPPIYCPMSATPGNQFYFWPRYDGTVRYSDIAHELLPSLEAAPRAALAAALAGLNIPGTPESETKARVAFLAQLHDAAPDLGIDVQSSEEMGFSRFTGRTALYITDRERETKPASSLMREFRAWKVIAEFEVTDGGLPLRKFRVFACSDYRQPEL